uniref:Uncharacterized protein n=1 Tax=Latimeria chalumnae TaxID=7897 RepID=H3A5S4_LATCH
KERNSLHDFTRLFLNTTKFHGIKYIFSGHIAYPRKLIWLLAFLVSLGLLVTWSSNRIRYLLSSPVHTKVHMVYAKNLTFPAVTICNNNLLLLRRMTKSDLYLTGYWLGLLNENFKVQPTARDILKDDRWKWLERLLNFSHYLPPRDTEDLMFRLMNRLGHQIEEMLLSCKFQGDSCGPQNFTTVSHIIFPSLCFMWICTL